MATDRAYRKLLEVAETTIRHRSALGFFRDGAADRAAQAAVLQLDMRCGDEAIISALSESLERDFHVCFFDDPCDAWAA